MRARVRDSPKRTSCSKSARGHCGSACVCVSARVCVCVWRCPSAPSATLTRPFVKSEEEVRGGGEGDEDCSVSTRCGGEEGWTRWKLCERARTVAGCCVSAQHDDARRGAPPNMPPFISAPSPFSVSPPPSFVCIEINSILNLVVFSVCPLPTVSETASGERNGDSVWRSATDAL